MELVVSNESCKCQISLLGIAATAYPYHVSCCGSSSLRYWIYVIAVRVAAKVAATIGTITRSAHLALDGEANLPLLLGIASRRGTQLCVALPLSGVLFDRFSDAIPPLLCIEFNSPCGLHPKQSRLIRDSRESAFHGGVLLCFVKVACGCYQEPLQFGESRAPEVHPFPMSA